MTDEHDQTQGPTPPLSKPQALNSALMRNIRALQARREEEEKAASLQHRVADTVTAFSGSMPFVYIHLAILAAWIAINLGLVRGAPVFDRSFVILATAASVEAIFLSTFVLISQNRAAEAANRRADLDLQINLLAEHEITRLISLTSEIAMRLGIAEAAASDLDEFEHDVAPEAVLDSLEAAARSPRKD
jgi:uncharacterized membrane protein